MSIMRISSSQYRAERAIPIGFLGCELSSLFACVVKHPANMGSQKHLRIFTSNSGLNLPALAM